MRLRIKRSKYFRKGFTLLEVLIATIVLTVGVLGIVWAFTRGMAASTDVENIDLALNVAQANMEDVFETLKNTDLTTLNIANFETSHSGDDPDFSDFNVTTDLTDVNGDASLMRIDIAVSWEVKGDTASIGFTTLVAD